jgi:energy-coupling factor transport system ATP-binding protein
VGFVELRDVSYSYPRGRNRALSGISLSIPAGSYTAVIGGNGSGKSTLSRLITGLLIPDEGQILVDGRDTSDSSEHRAIRKKAGLVFQNPSTQVVATVVREDTAFGPESLALDSAEIRSRVESALNSLSLSPLSLRGTHQLSAGQQQRLALAGVMALGARCLILDEAESMLNPLGRIRLDRLLDDLHRRGYTIIRITHFMEQAVRADHILVLHRGELVRQGGREIFFEEDSVLDGWNLSLPPAGELGALLEKVLPGMPLSTDMTEGELAARLEGTVLSRPYDSDASSSGAAEETAGTEPPSSEELIRLSGAGRSYSVKSDNPVIALRDVDFTLRRGESLAVLGRTGSGKSTFLQLLNGLLLPDKGEISILGENPLDKGCDLTALRTRVALVMQQPEKQLFAPLTGDDVAFGPRMQGLEGRELALRVRDAMETAGLSYREFKDVPVRALSGGRKRKAALAGILAMEPEVLLRDEPSAGLDPSSARQLEQMLLTLREKGTSLVTVTHSVEQALRLAPARFVVFAEGRLVYDGAPSGFFRTLNPEELGLEYPLAARIALSIGCDPSGLPLTPRALADALGRETLVTGGSA